MLQLLKKNGIVTEINTLIKKKYVDEFYDKAGISNHYREKDELFIQLFWEINECILTSSFILN